MNTKNDWLRGKDGKQAIQSLSKCVGRDIPEVFFEASRSLVELLEEAAAERYETSWQDAIDQAKELLEIYDAGREIRTPAGRQKSDLEPDTSLTVEVSDHTRRRAEAYAAIAAMRADRNHSVRRFRQGDPKLCAFRRSRFPAERRLLLTEDECREFLNLCGGPNGIREEQLTYRKLEKLGRELHTLFGWREGDGIWFVLTGIAPDVEPLKVSCLISPTPIPLHLSDYRTEKQRREAIKETKTYHAGRAEITVTADVWTNPAEVAEAFRQAQKQIIAGKDSAPRVEERTAAVVKFVAQLKRKKPRITWREICQKWNVTQPREWRYEDYRKIYQTFTRFENAKIDCEYRIPNYKLREQTPYEKYTQAQDHYEEQEP